MKVAQTILFCDGTIASLPVHVYRGACLAGQPTAYVYRGKQFVWVKPGASVSWMEV